LRFSLKRQDGSAQKFFWGFRRKHLFRRKIYQIFWKNTQNALFNFGSNFKFYDWNNKSNLTSVLAEESNTCLAFG